MKQRIVVYPPTGSTYHDLVLDNGLKVLVCEMPGFSGVHAAFTADYGSTQRSFFHNGKHTVLPAGVAHFLEHKMFENENEDAFELYAKTGASANAYTSFNKTSYIFSASENVDEALDILLNFVSKPHFTAATVQKEQGIIGQEIKMYDDAAEWRLMFGLLENMYINHAVKQDIAGTVESIAQITPEMLYDCHAAFYSPENMALTVAGNITLEQVLKACERADIKAAHPDAPKVVLEEEIEPREIAKKHTDISMLVAQPVAGMAYKLAPFKSETLLADYHALELLLDILVGDSSPFFRKLYDAGLINPGFEAEIMHGKGYAAIVFSGESKNPQAVFAALKSEIAQLAKAGISEQMFTLCKNAMYGDVVTELEHAQSISSGLADAAFQGYGYFEPIEVIKNLKIEDVQRMLNTVFDEQYCTTCVITPKV